MTGECSADQALVKYHAEGDLGFITLSRPEKRNALNLKVWNALDCAIARAEEDTQARVVLVRGEGKSFCAGLDLSPDNDIIPLITANAGAHQKTAFYRVVRKLQAIHTRLERLSRPTIAVIQGHCLGAGLELALCCDFRLCSADAVFALPEATLAIITDVGGLQRLAKAVGPGHAREIAFRGNRFSAERAKAINLVNDVCPDPESLAKSALDVAAEIAANPPLAVQGAKDVFVYSDEVPMDHALDFNAARSSMIMPSEDLMEAMSAYLQKRKGQFKGA